MKISERSNYRPRLSLGLKRYLLALNRDIDGVKSDIKFNREYGFYYNHSLLVASNHLSPLEVTVLYMEDRRFFLHRGIELRSLLRGFRRMLSRGRFGGISTIDQQVVRISTGRNQRTIGRKVRELSLAFFLNFHCTKSELLNYYIHHAYLGYRIEGVEEAAKKLFGIQAAQLNWKQSAFIASLFPLPFPKAVWNAYSVHPSYPNSDPSFIMNIAKAESQRWADRVAYRMNLANSGQDFKPRSL
ncbi:biosynthetic peptidoglycan transglycosylase [Roseobacter litoralis]|uniref:biosynthetic peptidoglycan transglycosylase n=1 Tax=Roseobacter litoralis TaxID=42443 RepID=UPI00249363E5|nr:biosynthetic peptidoglycan transglycosylase [Roseobacter litoralis]